MGIYESTLSCKNNSMDIKLAILETVASHIQAHGWLATVSNSGEYREDDNYWDPQVLAKTGSHDMTIAMHHGIVYIKVDGRRAERVDLMDPQVDLIAHITTIINKL